MNKLDKAYQSLCNLSEKKEYHNYLRIKYQEYKNQLETIDNQLDQEMAYIQDNRTPQEHFIDICRGWLVEDLFAYLFMMPTYEDLTLKFDNHDKDRIIRVLRKEITSKPDFKITYQNKTISMEVQSLYANVPYFHIKEHKAKKMINNNSYLLQLNMIHPEIIIFSPQEIELGEFVLIEDFSTETIKKYGYRYYINELPKDMKIYNFTHDLPEKIISLFY